MFDTWWNEIDQRFGGFHNIDLNIDAMRARYRPEIEAGVSRGRFAGIMAHFTYQLQELHTYLFDIPVRNTAMNKGVPLMVIGQFGTNPRFGALLTPLPDSTLLVYEVLPDHPLRLEPGDVVLGYDGVLWKDIYPTLLEAELPLFLNPVNGSTEQSNYYYAMQAAGLNWHLFDTIDIVKYSSGDTLHFDTNRLAGLNRTLWGKEQIPPPGVPWPNPSRDDRIGWGVIEGTNVGLVTVTSWSFDAQLDIRARFEQAVDQLMHVVEADGIIFDFRFNTGGGAVAREGLQLLFNETVPTVGFDQRVPGSSDHFAMEPDPLRREANLVIQGNPETFFDKPIAILIGPGSISAGELEARRLSFHPQARIFGLPAPGGNTGSDFISIGDSDWFVSRSHSTQYLVSTHEYLTHLGLTPDERVWFTQEDAANGIDTIIKAALDWIDSTSTNVEDEIDSMADLEVASYPNPFRDKVILSFKLDAPAHVSITLYDLLGRRVTTLMHAPTTAGSHRVTWNGKNLHGTDMSTGLYFWKVTAGAKTKTGTVMLVR
ncbi:MAG TPA: S41 family peptidase [Rhodothermales bacterium]|nr:S41 family peptidase [Rhodothermales bacterium]